MHPERWQQIDRLFHLALEQNPGQRPAFLAQACSGDKDLCSEIEALISAHEEGQSFIETPAFDLAAEMLTQGSSGIGPGQSVGPYKIKSILGIGGMGEVYLAQDTRLGRQVALKILPRQFTIDAQRVHRFEQEARAASALNHPNIITIHEIGRINATQFIVTEFVDGQTLRQRMTAAPISPSEALEIAIQVAGALEAAHAAGIVHRDIKPENIMLRADGYVKVLDFGLAKLTELPAGAVDSEAETRAHLKTDPGMVMGTVQYMSPEQARGRDVDAGTDLWSLGVVLYEMVSGEVPFKGETPSHVVVSILESPPPVFAQPLDGLSSEFERIVIKTLRKSRKERYQAARELALDLKSLKGELEIEARLQRSPGAEKKFGAGPLEALTVARTTTPKVIAQGTQPLHPVSSAEYLVNEVSRHKRVVAIIAALLVIAIMAGSYFYFGRKATVHSIAVLPFTNAGNNPDMEYLSDGLSESLTNNLSPVPGLTVIARYSSFKYKGKEADPQEVAKNLGVDAIVTGRIAQLADNFLINIELVDAHTGKQIWGKQYTRKASDLLAMQSEMTQEITRELRLRLTDAEQQQLTQVRAVNPQAFDLYLKGRALWVKGGDENTKKAIEYYQQAIAVDPGYALVYAQMANSYSALITNDVLPQKEFGPKAEAAALKAVELDDNLAEAHLAVAGIQIDAWDWAAAEREIKRALELNPNLVAAHRLYSQYYANHRRLEESVAELERARDLDPLSMSASEARLISLAMYRQNAEALDLAKKILELNKSHPGSYERVGTLSVRVGQYREAIAAYQEAIKLGKNNAGTQILLAAAYAHLGERDKARELIERYESGKEYLSPVTLATVHVALGERDQAFALLEKAYAARDQTLIWLRGEWEFDVLHDDPRFQDLARRVGLSD
ncbi:MAG: eukaryotic-like serine/threonine-protein kinase [Blastocatellia bacterium]|nr:eukaryotic-like serine/threonine-protein kinase [Blastocatellia bacterium]